MSEVLLGEHLFLLCFYKTKTSSNLNFNNTCMHLHSNLSEKDNRKKTIVELLKISSVGNSIALAVGYSI
jgi:hypothetical protein